MGDDDELGLLAHLAHIPGKAHHIGVVQGGLDLVHDHEGSGTHLQNGKVKGDGHKGLFAAGEEGDDLQALPRGLDLDLNAAVEDILNCGIEIKVQPPGKSLKIITLLSGGEKAFVAIALYFAILKVRPTPFVVMDEIEAALDDPNVVRFARYMRQMSEKTQFIVITHRRGTMEEADALYGVTMQEQGVTRVLTINLNDVEKELNIK